MAGIDYTIPQQFKGIQVESPINAMAQAMQLRNLQESSEMNALRRREYQRAREEEEAVRNWFASGKKLDSPEALNELYARAPSAAANIEKSMLERSKAAAEIGYKKAQTAGEDIKTQRERLDFTERALYKSTTPEAAIGHINQAVTLGYLTPDAAEQMKASVPNDPNQFQSWRMNLLTHSLSAKDLLDRLESQQDLEYAAAGVKAVESSEPIPSREAFFGLQPKVAPTAAPTSSVSAITPVPTPDTTVVTRSADVVAPTTAPSTNAASQPNIEPIVLNESFVDYKNKAILNNRGHIPDQDTYFAAQDRLARQASAVAAKTTAAPTTTTTAPPPAPGEDRALDPVELISGFKGIDPQAADLYKLALTMKNPDARAQLNKIADQIQQRSQLTGEFFNVDRAEQIITELEKNKTPENVRRIAALRGAIKAANLGKGTNVTVVTDKQQTEFEKKLGAGQAEKLLEDKAKAEDARDMLDTVRIGRDILKSGVITGAGADFFVGLNQALKTAGVDFGYADASANSQAYSANMAQNVGKLIKLFGAGTGLSDADRAYAEKMAGGKIALDKKALEKILDIQDRASRNVIKRYNKKAAGIKTNIPLEVEIEAENASPAPAPKPAGTLNKLSSEDKQALDWANANPKDPRSAQIKQRLGVK